MYLIIPVISSGVCGRNLDEVEKESRRHFISLDTKSTNKLGWITDINSHLKTYAIISTALGKRLNVSSAQGSNWLLPVSPLALLKITNITESVEAVTIAKSYSPSDLTARLSSLGKNMMVSIPLLLGLQRLPTISLPTLMMMRKQLSKLWRIITWISSRRSVAMKRLGGKWSG